MPSIIRVMEDDAQSTGDNRKMRSDYIGINDQFGSKYAVLSMKGRGYSMAHPIS